MQLGDLLRKPDCQWSYSKARIIDGAGQEMSEAGFPKWHPYAGRIFEELLMARIACATVLAKRNLLDEVGGFDESLRFCNDYDLWLRLSRRADVRTVPEILATVRLHAGSTTRRSRLEVMELFVHTYHTVLHWDVSRRAESRCDTQCAFYLVHLANDCFVAGRYSEALRRLWQALLHRPLYFRWRVVLFKGLLRPLVPAGATRK